MKPMYRLQATMLIVYILYSCSVLIPDDDAFTLLKVQNTSSKLKLEGYYHYSDKTQIVDTYFFYSNGVILNLGAYPIGSEENLEELEKNFLKLKPGSLNFKTVWGLYEIKGDIIRFERYYPGNAGAALHSGISSGKILNDTTFLITQVMGSNGTDVKKVNELYRFKKFSPKPDSTNNFL